MHSYTTLFDDFFSVNLAANEFSGSASTSAKQSNSKSVQRRLFFALDGLPPFFFFHSLYYCIAGTPTPTLPHTQWPSKKETFRADATKTTFLIERGHWIDLKMITRGRSHLSEKTKLRLIHASSVYTDEVSIQSTEFFQLMRRLDVGIETHK